MCPWRELLVSRFATLVSAQDALEQRVDERRDRRALRKNDECTEQKEGDQHRHKPPSLVAPKKGEQSPDDSETTRGGSRNAGNAHDST